MEVAVHLQTKTYYIQSASSSESHVSLDLFRDFFVELRAELGFSERHMDHAESFCRKNTYQFQYQICYKTCYKTLNILKTKRCGLSVTLVLDPVISVYINNYLQLL
jgi:hypothetical protein